MTATPSYPLFDTRITGRINVRGYDSHAGASRTCDIAAVALELADAGHLVTAVAAHTPKMVETIGLGWNPQNIRIRSAHTLVEATMFIYEAAAAAPADPHVVLVEDFTSLRTGPGRGHDDEVALDWLRAVAASDAAALCEITGLSVAGYLHDSDAKLPESGVIAGAQLRRGDGPASRRIMGGLDLIASAESVVAVNVHPVPPGTVSHVLGLATVLKSRHPGVLGDHTITRSIGGLRFHPWAAAARTAV